MTTNPVVLQILTEDLGMPEDEARSQLENNTLNLNPYRFHVTNDIVIAIAENFESLTTINLSYCRYITDIPVIALAERCAGLTTVDLSQCDAVTDDGIIALAENCPGLTKIWLNDCENITDAALIALAENCEYLDNIYCEDTKVGATGYQLIEDIKTRPKPPPLEEGWWMDDGTGPRCKGMMN